MLNKLNEANLSTKHKRLKNPNWRGVDQLDIFTSITEELNYRVYRETPPAK